MPCWGFCIWQRLCEHTWAYGHRCAAFWTMLDASERLELHGHLVNGMMPFFDKTSTDEHTHTLQNAFMVCCICMLGACCPLCPSHWGSVLVVIEVFLGAQNIMTKLGDSSPIEMALLPALFGICSWLNLMPGVCEQVHPIGCRPFVCLRGADVPAIC